MSVDSFEGVKKTENTDGPERAIIVGLTSGSMPFQDCSTEESLDELEALLETAGGVCIGRVLQYKDKPHPGTFIGKGKVEEVKEYAEANDCTLVVFDNELTPAQTRTLTDALELHVLDRSSLILDIFAGRARTREGRLQVELAQYNYILPRLSGMWKHLGRQTATSAPIGTRGPGETQLETDRRHIRRKIDKLKDELNEVIRVRDTQRRQREKNHVPVVALVGYTSAGKSTLLNTLTGSGTQTIDRLFDTLDTTTRRLDTDNQYPGLITLPNVLVSDTVGFIRKLPHHLIDAFKATLEELTYADLLIHVIDASNSEWEIQARVVDEMIESLGAGDTPRIEAFNKCDRQMADVSKRGDGILLISAKTGFGIDKLLIKIDESLSALNKRVTLRFPYDKAGLVEMLHREGTVFELKYESDYIEIDAVVDTGLYKRIEEFVASE